MSNRAWYGLSLLAAILFAAFYPRISHALYEEVKVTSVHNVSILACPPHRPGEGNNASHGAYLHNYSSGGPITLTEGLGFITGAVAGAATGYYVFGSKAATAVGALSGGWTGYKLFQSDQGIVVDKTRCIESPGYKVNFTRVRDGLQGAVVMKIYPVGKNIMLNFCSGRQGEPERPC